MLFIGEFRNNKNACRTIILCSCLILLAACVNRHENAVYRPLNNTQYLPEPDTTVNIRALSNCTHSSDNNIHLNTAEPVTVLVHGCFSSAGRFRSLAEALAFHGQQVICFNYNDRDSLMKSSHELIVAIETLSGVLQQPEITLIGHSQGGVIARRALINERTDRLATHNVEINLITVSAPFGGIKFTSACGSTTLAWLTLGLIKPICQLAAGNKYKEITPNSEFTRHPGRLIPAVTRHLRIITDETNTCRRYNKYGDCIEDDYVLSLDEQTHRTADMDMRLSSVLVKSGHVEIMGGTTEAPQKLIGILQQQEFLKAAPLELEKNLAQSNP